MAFLAIYAELMGLSSKFMEIRTLVSFQCECVKMPNCWLEICHAQSAAVVSADRPRPLRPHTHTHTYPHGLWMGGDGVGVATSPRLAAKSALNTFKVSRLVRQQ